MRNLVYRVQPLPQSMLPLVWDFGQLDSCIEKMYIRQMVLRYVCISNGIFSITTDQSCMNICITLRRVMLKCGILPSIMRCLLCVIQLNDMLQILTTIISVFLSTSMSEQTFTGYLYTSILKHLSAYFFNKYTAERLNN